MKVSIIIPTYNRAALLCELLESLVRQSHRPIEILVVDDGSTDNTAAAMKDFFAACATEVGVTHHYELLRGRHGAQVARNRGIELAAGHALMFVDSDDVLAPDGLHQLAEALEAQPEWDYAYGRVEMVDEKLAALSPAQSAGAPFRADMPVDLMGYHWHTMGALYRRRCIDRVGAWNEELTGSQDWEYQARVKIHGGTGGFVDALVGYWRQLQAGRIGANSFREDYVRSVMKACDSILKHARFARRSDVRLEKRIARRLVVHGLEWGANGSREQRKTCFDQALDSLSSPSPYKLGIWFVSWWPRLLDRLAVVALHRAQNRG